MTSSRLLTALTLPLALALGACSEAPLSAGLAPSGEATMNHQGRPHGTGLVADVVGEVTLPLVGGNQFIVDQAVITNIALVENAVGQIVGLQATGTLSGTIVEAAGGLVAVEAQPFTAALDVTSSGPGQCSAVTLDLSSINLGALGLVEATVPVAVDVKSSGAVGSLLCNLGRILGGLAGGLTGGAAGGLVNAINNQI